MDTKDIIRATDSTKRLVQDDHYYKYIFKKTERIVSVVFYILNSVPENKKTQSHIEDIQHAARAVHDAVLLSLESRSHVAEDVVRGVAHSLIGLQSKLTVAQVAGVISADVLNVFVAEVSAVLRGINKYTGDQADVFSAPALQSDTAVHERNTAVLHKHHTKPKQSTTSSSIESRRERIKTILEAKGEASIKDISEIITDVSEKTIQRELQAMIEDNVVKRVGERRWSKYLLF